MGSPFSPVISNFFMEDFKKKILEQATHKTVYWFRYIDDTFVIWPQDKEKLTEFLNHFNRLHNKIQFTIEKEECHIPFLNIDIYRETDCSLGHESTGNSPIQISICTRIHITILQTNHQSSLHWYTQPKLSVTRISSTKNWNSQHRFQGRWIQP